MYEIVAQTLISLLLFAALGLTQQQQSIRPSNKPANIIMLMTDDQDLLLGSLDYQPTIQKELKVKGTEFTKHFVTTAICCPSRASLLRGQLVHNTNITHVVAPGGNYDKFVLSGQDQDYLPFWMKNAGYRTEYIGKLLNGYSQLNYNVTPKGWDRIDALIDPYTYSFNNPITSTNGQRPVYYKGYHQSDVIRAKSLDRIEHLADQEQPFLLIITPTVPHNQRDSTLQATPLLRHEKAFSNVTTPRLPNWNPDDKYQQNKGSWLSSLQKMNESAQDHVDHMYRQRIRALLGVDEMVEDIIGLLEAKGALENTYFIYTSDNGYHIGNHRIPGGKSLFYAEDTNIPFLVRGPGIPANVTSKIPGSHVDLAPNFLDIAGVAKDEWPTFLDGQSLLSQWHDPEASNGPGASKGNAKETLNIEFWGGTTIEKPRGDNIPVPPRNNSYKALRLVGDDASWLYSTWCTGDTELYNTADDPHELDNLAINPSKETSGLINRLNAILLVTKSCEQATCRQPWSLLQPENGTSLKVYSLKQALDVKYDDFFASFPHVAFKKCLTFQDTHNEAPYYPALPEDGSGLGRKYRGRTDNYISKDAEDQYIDSKQLFGSEEQRHVTLDQILKAAREVTDEELYKSGSDASRRVKPRAWIPEWMRMMG